MAIEARFIHRSSAFCRFLRSFKARILTVWNRLKIFIEEEQLEEPNNMKLSVVGGGVH